MIKSAEIPGGRLLVNWVPMREQRTAKLTLNSVFNILKLIPLFTVSSQKATLSNAVIKTHTLILLQPFPEVVKNIPFALKNGIFPTALNDDSAGHCPPRKKRITLSHHFFFMHRYTTYWQAPPPPGLKFSDLTHSATGAAAKLIM